MTDILRVLLSATIYPHPYEFKTQMPALQRMYNLTILPGLPGQEDFWEVTNWIETLS